MNKKVLCLFSVLLASFLFITNVCALNIVEAGETVVHSGEYDSTRLVAGNRVTNEATVNGLSLIAGNEVSLKGTTEYGFYAGNILTINEKIRKDAFIAGNSVTIGSDAFLGRDVFIAGSNIVISADITRDLRVAAGLVDLRGITINGDAYVTSEELLLDKDTVIAGKLSYYEDTKVEGLEVATIGSKDVLKVKDVVVDVNPTTIIISFIEKVLAALIVMLVLFYFIPISKDKLDKLEVSVGGICKTSLIGLGLIIIIPIIAIIALLTGILTPLALITFVIYFISLYIGTLVASYLVGKYISTKVFKNDSVYLELLVGIVLIRLIALIPYVGGIVTIISLLYGFGLIFKFIKARNN